MVFHNFYSCGEEKSYFRDYHATNAPSPPTHLAAQKVKKNTKRYTHPRRVWWEADSSLNMVNLNTNRLLTSQASFQFGAAHARGAYSPDRRAARVQHGASPPSAEESRPRARGWEASWWPARVSWGNKKSDTTSHRRPPPSPPPKGSLAFTTTREALRKSGCFLANFARPVPIPRPQGIAGPPTSGAPSPHRTFTSTFSRIGQPLPKVLLQGPRPPPPPGGRTSRGASSPPPPSAARDALLPLPAQASPRAPRAAAGPPPPPLPARSESFQPPPPAARAPAAPFKWKPLSRPPPAPPSSACGRSVPPCPAPHRNECGRAARPAPPRRAASRPPSLRGLRRLQRLPRRMV